MPKGIGYGPRNKKEPGTMTFGKEKRMEIHGEQSDERAQPKKGKRKRRRKR